MKWRHSSYLDDRVTYLVGEMGDWRGLTTHPLRTIPTHPAGPACQASHTARTFCLPQQKQQRPNASNGWMVAKHPWQRKSALSRWGGQVNHVLGWSMM